MVIRRHLVSKISDFEGLMGDFIGGIFWKVGWLMVDWLCIEQIKLRLDNYVKAIKYCQEYDKTNIPELLEKAEKMKKVCFVMFKFGNLGFERHRGWTWHRQVNDHNFGKNEIIG